MGTLGIITTVIAALGLLLALWQFIKNLKSQKENLKLQKQNLELQQQLLEHQRETEAKTELKEKIEEFEEKKGKKSELKIYCDHITQKFKYLDFTGLNAILQKPLLLEEIYVKLRAKESFRLAQYHTIADFKELDKEKSEEAEKDFVKVFERMHQKAIKQREPLKIVILGQPGSGKTTLMKWIALQCACDGEKVFSDFIPVFIPLKDLGRDPGQTYKTYNIMELTVNRLKHDNISTTFIHEAFEDNNLLFLLDGLDEVADEDRRREVIEWIQNQNIRKNALLVTSRFSGLHETRGLKFHDAIPVFTVQDFDIADIERFLENWYKNIEVAVAGEGDKADKEEAIKKGKSSYEDLMNIIKSDAYKNLRQLAVNPLLLTIIAIVHRTRAVLPKERHKLYDECLKVMIELWNVANKKLNISFSVENSMDNLAKIAVYLMKQNRREIELSEIKTLLPSEIENQSLDFFLNQMILRAGLLYESEGKYGFLHLTLQEYLAAWHFTRKENQNEILEYRDKDYWTETFKLFVNTGNARNFYNEIIDNLEEKDYWQYMQLWDDCLDEIVVEETQKEIEFKFARKILNILPGIQYKEEKEAIIIQLYAHYPLYKHAKHFKKEGWHLFNNARHPFVQSVGSSILNKAGEDTRTALMEALKSRMNEFEKIENKTHEQLLDFIYQNDNSFTLLIAGRKNLRDFNFALAKLKSRDFFLVYVDLRDLRYLLDLRDLRYLRDLLDLRDLRDLRYLRYLRDLLDLRDLRYLRDLRDLRYLPDRYLEKYESIIEEHKKEIDNWADKAIAKLHALSDEGLLKYFPGTGAEDLKAFRDSKGKSPGK
ncbi:MAG: NACHT domain-containing protein [Candidatus Aminicenantes bacterium]|nr:NACHT domain-containing protein [Candidatus Aminicenantes bacterium]NIM82626.1 NACHT domain-containing protein [Candidatus Aminicenantes bacterium]NIN21994.1 NACHT domain-containing protein [Candidatus Aminicenantes bacterium]NIN45756.1 NACHT domain-containing protein [Candidatus Aminicenantes bacterium]NIN88594.1 NACHT domain-containing protein [Candidatus Aminicenantes bacterium]